MSRILVWKAALVLGLAALSPFPASAIGSVTAGGVTFGYTNNFNTTTSNTVDVAFTGAGPADMAFESWWFYRVSGGSRESAFANPDIELYDGSLGQLGWDDPTGSSLFSASLSFEVFDSGAGGNLFQNMRIYNTSGADLTIDVFHYSDLDVNGTGGSDRASLGSNAAGIQINQSEGAQTAPIVGYGANAYRVSPYAQVLGDLTDNGVDNFANTGLPVNTPQDVTVGFQWSVTIAAGSYRDFMTQFGSNAPLLNPTVTVIPEPGTAVLMGLGLLVLAVSPRAARAA
ncbi:MAG: hypothetical protein IPK00_17575 [Deltaproteobacteria bacterium]|nr:hypothetical protein [Deltaproteobacteria bacterium]